MSINKPTTLFLALCASLSSGPVLADIKMNGNPIITKVSVQSLEYGFGSGANTLNWEQAQLQIGTGGLGLGCFVLLLVMWNEMLLSIFVLIEIQMILDSVQY